jgi:signal transduction histidine kinase
LYEDKKGNLWGNLHQESPGNLLGSNSNLGLFRRTPEGEVRFYGNREGLDNYYIRGITEDNEGRLCLAVWYSGFYRFDGKEFEKFGIDRWPGLKFIHGLHCGPGGGMWITTERDGLFYFKEGRFRQWTSADGLPDMLLRAVVADDQGNLWFSSNNGIFGCSREALKLYERGKSSQVLFWRLSVRDGLASKLASGAGQPVATRSADGRLWFPNYRALAGFDPAVVRETGRTLAPLIEEVSADGVLLSRASAMGLRVRSGVRRIEFHYTCSDLRAPERLRFQYKLDGIDDGWSKPGAQRMAVYGPLPPGKYVFHVKAGGASIEWHEAQEDLTLIVVPRWWERTSVRIVGVVLGVLLTGGTVWLVARARHRRKLARLQLQQVQEAERRRIARDIHDDLGATLTRMLWMGEMSGSPEAAQIQMRRVATAARDMSQSLEAIVWAVRPENDTLHSLVVYLGRRMDELFEGASTAYRFVAPHELPERMVFAETRHNVFLACKEALTNALKHSKAASVVLELFCLGDECHITITDDGLGFDSQSTRRTGAAGLKNMQSRMEEIKGGFELHSEPGKGTIVRLRFPIPPLTTA